MGNFYNVTGINQFFLVVLYLGISLNTISITVLILIIVNAVIAAYIITGGLAAHEGIRELLSKLYIWKVGLKWYIVALLIFPVITYLSLSSVFSLLVLPLVKYYPKFQLVLFTELFSLSFTLL